MSLGDVKMRAIELLAAADPNQFFNNSAHSALAFALTVLVLMVAAIWWLRRG